jgi:hypothetical protein
MLSAVIDARSVNLQDAPARSCGQVWRKRSPRLLVATIFAASLALLGAPAAPALASGPATVTVRVEGLTETRLPATNVTTTTTPVVGEGDPPQDACPGTSALGALELATGGDWSGPWNSEFGQYEIYSIEGETHVFEAGASANYYWSFWLDDKESSLGACEAEAQEGDQVLFFPACYGEACPPAATPLGIEAPASADAGEAVPVTVKRYDSQGEASPVAGATVSAAAMSVTTDADGHAQLDFPSAGRYTLRASAGPESVRTETVVCVHDGEDGNCGTRAPSGSPTGSSAPAISVGGAVARRAPYTGPYALVADATGIRNGHVYPRRHAPRLLSGKVMAHVPVTSISLRLRRTYRGRCWAYDGVSERLARRRCSEGSFFKVASGGESFSYLLPFRLPVGRYVLDLDATDAAGNRTTLARGTSRIVFYVK